MSRLTRYLLPVLAAACLTSTAHATDTPYNLLPSCFIANGQCVWDDQFAAMLNNAATTEGINPNVVFVFDFCFSGGFVNDLAANNHYIATAADWDETSSSNPPGKEDLGPFGQSFMLTAAGGATLHNSYLAAATTMLNLQLPQESAGTLGGTTLAYNPGDQAIIFSSGDTQGQQNNFWTDVTTTHTALNNLGWANNSIQTLWDQGQTAPGQIAGDTTGAGYVNGASTVAALTNAVNTAYANLAISSPTSKLFVYINDHGDGTDQLKSKTTMVAANDYKYSYESVVGVWRGWTDNSPYGIWQVKIKVGDQTPADYFNWVDPVVNGIQWTHQIVGNFIIFQGSEANRNSWMVSGLPYDYGYDNIYAPAKVQWDDYLTSGVGTSSEFDGGFPDGSAFGSGYVVYNQGPIPSVDPSGLVGWDNGGDGWVESPVPEPASLTLLTLGSAALFTRRRAAKKAINR